MNRIERKFEELRQKDEKALVGFVTAGDPDVAQSIEIISAMCAAGLDVLELGIPFSDPSADGPAIQRSSARALAHRVNLTRVLEMIRRLRDKTSIPIVLFGYYNPILQYGADKFRPDARAAGNGISADSPDCTDNACRAHASHRRVGLRFFISDFKNRGHRQ